MASTPSLEATPTETPRSGLPARLLREPLLHFLLLGGLLFGIDHAIQSRSDDPRTIVIGAAVDRELRTLYEARAGQPPSAEQLRALRQAWLDNEVLYREGLALGVDRGDPAIRERVIFKALSVVDAGVKLPDADEATLRAWFASHRAKYDEPARVDFDDALPRGEASEAAVRALAARLDTRPDGDADAALRVYNGRPVTSLAPSFGTAFAAALEAAPDGRWLAIEAGDGWHAVRLRARVAGRAADFEDARAAVLLDWRDAMGAAQRGAAVQAMARKYRVVSEDAGR